VQNKPSRRTFLAIGAAAAAFPSALAKAAPPDADPGAGVSSFDNKTVTVSAGRLDRRQTVVEFPLSERLTKKTAGATLGLVLQGREGDNSFLDFQVTPNGRAAFILPEMKAGETRTYNVALVSKRKIPGGPNVSAVAKSGDVQLWLGALDQGRQMFAYHGTKVPAPAGFGTEYDRGGYLEPLLTPSGVRVTDDYPPNHKHHHGVWAPWTATRFEGRKPDFWNMGQKSGTVEFVELGPAWSGEVAAGFTAKHRFVDLSAPVTAPAAAGAEPQPKVALNETWEVQAYYLPGTKGADGAAKRPTYHLFDWQSIQTCATDSPLLLPKYQYGGLGVRGNRLWDGAANSAFLTSEGKTRKDGNDTRARWVAMSGRVDGKSAYVAILCHPGNFRSPQPVRLHPKEPFLCYSPQIQGDMAIEPGKPYVSRYRFVVGDGEPDKAELDRLWVDYGDPVRVEVR
jgi:hypothetical protein